MVRIDPITISGTGNISPPLASPSSCSSWTPSFLPNSFPYPPQEASAHFQGPVPVQYYPPINPYPFGLGFGFGFGFGYSYGYSPYPPYGYYQYQPQVWFQPPPPAPPQAPEQFNGSGSGRVRDSGRAFGSGGGPNRLKKGTTTLMIRNIPSRLRRNELMDLLDEHCRDQNKSAPRASPKHQAAYDFVYLPFDFVKRGNLGYAFVNFTTARAAFMFFKCWSGRGWLNFYQCSKICEITRADIQGKEASKRHLERCTFFCDTDEYLPVEISPPSNGFNAAATNVTTFGNKVPSSGKDCMVWRRKVE